MSRGLSRRKRAAWDALIESEGPALGLSDCRSFLENKLVNDIFYEGTFKGGPCIVKCSSRAPESIENEYKMSRRLNAVAPVCAGVHRKRIQDVPPPERRRAGLRRSPSKTNTRCPAA